MTFLLKNWRSLVRMSEGPSVAEILSKEAIKAYEKKDWKRACTQFDAYFKKVYPDPNPEMSLADVRLLLKYADALLEKMMKEATNHVFDQEELNDVAEYVITAQKTFQKNKDSVTEDEMTETYRIRAEVARCAHQHAHSEEMFKEAYKHACAGNLSWRERLSALFNVAIAQELRERPAIAIETVNACIKLVDEELEKKPEEKTVEDLKEFRKSFEEKLTELEGDVKEQEANKDIIQNEEEDASEEEEEKGEEEEEEAAE